MKKMLVLIGLLAAGMVAFGLTANAQQGNPNAPGAGQGRGVGCQDFVDSNNSGVCDNYEAGGQGRGRAEGRAGNVRRGQGPGQGQGRGACGIGQGQGPGQGQGRGAGGEGMGQGPGQGQGRGAGGQGRGANR